MARLVLTFLAIAGIGQARGRCTSLPTCSVAAKNLLDAVPTPATSSLLGALTKSLLEARRDWSRSVVEPATSWCPTAAPFEWLPAATGICSRSTGWSANWSDDGCFASVSATAAVNATGGWFSITGTSPASSKCGTVYSASTSYRWSPLVEISAASPAATVAWEWAHGADEASDAGTLGLTVVQWPCGVAGTLLSLARTLPQLSADEEVAASAVADWLTAHGIYSGPVLPFTPPPKAGAEALALGDHIRSGAYLAISEWDFMASMEAFGTGVAGTSHSALAVRRNGTLFVTESTFGWPGGDGIQAHTWEEWLRLSDPVVSSSVLQLAPPLAGAFSEDAFWAWFDAVEGAPYGYSNYFYALLDTGAPLRSLPAPLDGRVVGAALVLTDDALGAANTGWFDPSYNVSIMQMFGAALNKRLNSSCASMACLVATAAAQQPRLSLMEAAAIPEDPAWVYDVPGGGGRPALVCSAFAYAGLQAGLQGALPPAWAPEQAPRDNWVAALWDPAGFNESSCPWGASVSDTGTRFCQFAGRRAQPMTGANSIPVYAHLNERCGSQWPAYQRCPTPGTACDC